MRYHLTRTRELKQKFYSSCQTIHALSPYPHQGIETPMVASSRPYIHLSPYRTKELKQAGAGYPAPAFFAITVPNTENKNRASSSRCTRLFHSLNRDRNFASGKTAPGTGLGRFFSQIGRCLWPLRLPEDREASCRLAAPGGRCDAGSRPFRRERERDIRERGTTGRGPWLRRRWRGWRWRKAWQCPALASWGHRCVLRERQGDGATAKRAAFRFDWFYPYVLSGFV